MIKTNIVCLIAVLIFISGCSNLSHLESRKERLNAKKSYLVAEDYIDTCKIHDRTLLSIDLGLLQTNISDNPELQELRIRIDSSIINFRNYLMSIDHYRNLMEYADRNGIRNRDFNRAQRYLLDSLSRESDEYSEMRNTSLSLIKENNLKILVLIVDDYKKRREEMPLDWMPGNIKSGILQNPEILNLDEKIEEIDNLILKKFGNKDGLVI